MTIRSTTDTMKQRATGTLGLENALEQAQAQAMYDEAGKTLLSHKEVLATILKYSVPEYAEYSCEELVSFIDVDSISGETPIAPDTDTRIHGDNTEQFSQMETNLTFDLKFRVIKPKLKNVHIHVDVELQGNYYPGYPLEKRGIYHLSRMISSQLEVVNRKTNYNKLEKAYSIFICVGNVPQSQQNTVSYYSFTNTGNIGDVTTNPENYDLMGLVLIRIGRQVTEEVAEVIKFLHALFYTTPELNEYIDFSGNEAFRKELDTMSISGEHLIEYGRDMEREKAQEQIREMKEKLEEENKKTKEKVMQLEADRLQEHNRVVELEAELQQLKEQMKKYLMK